MKKLATGYLLTCAVIGVAGGLILAPANWVTTVLFVAAPFAAVAISGLWLLPAVIALRLLQRPGAGILVGLISGLVAAPFSGYGFGSVATNLWWAFFAEVAFLVVGYRFWTTAQHFAGALVVSIVYPILAWQSFDLGAFPFGLQAAFFALVLAGTASATWAGIAIGDGLRKTGVASAARRRPRPVAVKDAAPQPQR